MRFLNKDEVRPYFEGKNVAIVGSGPGSLDNKPGFVDSHQVVVRVNNHRLGPGQGFRTDCHYSFYGASIHKTPQELKVEGVSLVMCKCPDGKFIESEWHRRNNKPHGTDFRYIYKNRKDWWFCPTFVPTKEEFLEVFELLGQHIPSTGFSAILAVLACNPKSVFLTGYDFFSSRTHNVNEPWRPGNPDDPIGHAPASERAWLNANSSKIKMDAALTAIMEAELARVD